MALSYISVDDAKMDEDSKSRRKITVNKKTLESLEVNCEWQDCHLKLSKAQCAFYKHVSSHIKDEDLIGIDEDGEEKYVCRWATCYFQTCNDEEIVRHVKYHAYHAELRALGSYVSKELNLPPCVIPNEFHVLNNTEDSPHVCQWSDCGESCLGIQEFIDHVQYHVRYSTNMSFKCQWGDCGSDFPKRPKLLDHMKTHIKQHFIACPECGHTFANKTKFADHCLTQKPLEEHVYQCDYCLSFHPTERILRKHMSQHIHHYKCPFCNMTCNTPSVLCKHIRYRHLDYKSFKCSLCDFMCKSKTDLQCHLLTHVTGFHTCQEPDCNYTTSSQLAMKRHIEAMHVPGKQQGPFCCHICNQKFTRGSLLTRHLSSKHNLKRPPGYSRFQYKLEEDGCKRLQSVRLESLDVHEMDLCGSNDEDSSDNENPQIFYQENQSRPKAITVDILGEKGQIVSSSVVIPDDSLPPDDAEIIAVGDRKSVV